MTRMLGGVLVFLALLGTSAAAQDRVPNPAAAAVAAPINLNTATATQLEGLPGVGLKMAERIVEYRQKNGGFKKTEDLMNVRGVGEKNFLKLKAMITVGPPKSERAAQQ